MTVGTAVEIFEAPRDRGPGGAAKARGAGRDGDAGRRG